MSIITSQQISNYYTNYSNLEITFTKEVIKTTQLVSKQIYLKCLGYQWPCIVYSSSMTGAKIIANVKSSIHEVVRKANSVVSLRFCFQKAEKGDPVSFFVSAKVVGYSPYNEANPDLNFISLSYTQRPADDLIETIGTLLEANVNSKKRKEERIILTTDAVRKLGMKAKEATVFVQGVPRKKHHPRHILLRSEGYHLRRRKVPPQQGSPFTDGTGGKLRNNRHSRPYHPPRTRRRPQGYRSLRSPIRGRADPDEIQDPDERIFETSEKTGHRDG